MLLSHIKLEFQNNCTILDVLPKISSDRDTKGLFGRLGRDGRALEKKGKIDPQLEWGVQFSS